MNEQHANTDLPPDAEDSMDFSIVGGSTIVTLKINVHTIYTTKIRERNINMHHAKTPSKCKNQKMSKQLDKYWKIIITIITVHELIIDLKLDSTFQEVYVLKKLLGQPFTNGYHQPVLTIHEE